MATSKGNRSDRSQSGKASGTQDTENTSKSGTSTTTRDSTQRSRDHRTSSKNTGDGAATTRRNNKSEPGRYQKRDEDSEDTGFVDGQANTSTERRARGASNNMESAFTDDDDVESAYADTDDADSDIDWDDDDSGPARGGRTRGDE